MTTVYANGEHGHQEAQSDLIKQINAAMEAHEEQYRPKSKIESRMRLHEELFAAYVEAL